MSRVDPSTFSWVKDEIDESIKQARLSLEAFSTATDDTSQMRMAVAFLHQVSGTLQIVELDGAARLVNELELVCEGLIDENIQPTDDNLDILSRGVLSLSTYISQLHAGYPDSIVALAPLINEMREVRGDEAVDDFDLFNPELDIYPEVSGNRPARLSDENFIAEASQARKQLLATMLSWFTQKNETQSLSTILLLFTHLKNISRFDVTSQLWWVATALTEALRDGGIDGGNNETRRFFAALEQELKRIITDGESSLVKAPQESLLKKMLFHVGKTTSRGPVVSELMHAFSLGEQVGGATDSDVVQIFEATSPDVLRPIMQALSEELAVAKGHLNDYFDTENSSEKSIEPLLQSLDKTRGAVEIINKKKVQTLVEEISHTAQAHDAGAIVINNNIALELAEGLLMLENACGELDDPSSDWEEKVDRAISDLHWIRTGEQAEVLSESGVGGIDIDEEGTLTDVEFSQLVKVVATEIGANLEEVVEKFEKYSLNMHLYEILKPIPEKLSQIEGALRILERERAIELVILINEQVSSMAKGSIKPSTEHVEITALAISAVESYADSLQHDQPASDLIIERAMEELLRTAPSDISDRNTAVERVKHIRDEADEWLRNPEDQLHLATLRKDMAAIISLANRNKDEKLEKIAEEVSSLVTLLSEDPEYLTDEIMSTFHQSLSILENLTGRLPEDSVLVEPEVTEVSDNADTEQFPVENDLGIELEEIDQDDLEPDLEIISPAKVEPEEDVIGAQAEEIENAAAEPVAREAAVFDDEILEIFLEEAREIAVIAKDLLSNWKSNTSDDASLIDLRRNFHTLKGSGRMSGAVEFGEFSWSFEELLNKIISGKIDTNDKLFAVCDEALDKLPSMLDDLAQHDESNINVDYWQECIEEAAKANVEEVETQELEAIDEDAAEKLEAEELEAIDEDAAEELEIKELEVTDEDIPGLPAALQTKTVRDIYSTEIQKHLEDLLSEIESSRTVDEPEVTDIMHRIIHTLRGSARSVGFDQVADAYESVENLLDGLSARSLYLTDNDLNILKTAYDLGMLLLDTIAKPEALGEDLLGSLSQLSSDSDARLMELPSSQMHDGTIEMPSYLSVTGSDAIDEPAGQEEDSETVQDKAGVEGNGEDESVDDLVEIFHEEAVDLLSRFHDSLESWREDSENAEGSTELKRIFHTIKGSARMTGITPIGDLAHNTESMLELAEKSENSIDEPLFELIEEVHDTLLMMVENPGSSEFDGQADEMNRRILNHFSSDADVQLVDEEVEENFAVEEEIVLEIQQEEQQEADDGEPVDELVEIFREEAIDLLSRFHGSLENWREDSSNEDAGNELKRIFHTIKGSARMTGISTIGDLAHNTESMLDLAEKAENDIDESLFELIEEVHDTLSMMVENPGSSEFDVAASEMNQRVLSHFTVVSDVAAEDQLADNAEDMHEEEADDGVRDTLDSDVQVASENVMPDVVEKDAQVSTEKIAPIEKKSAVPVARKDKTATGKQAQVRVDSDLLGTLANYAGEVSIARSRIQQQVSNFKDNLGELHNNIDRFQIQIRELEIQADTQISSRTEQAFNQDDEDFDPLEFDRYTQLQFLSRNLAESLHDLMMIQTGMDNFAGDVEMLLHEQSRLNTDLQEGLTQTRMVAFSTLMPRLRQLARKTSRELDKQINLELLGGEVELDRNVIDQVVPPLEHLIRNSISHGLEDAKTRKKQDKPEKGNLILEVKREGKDIIIEFSDDGQGLDLDKIRSKAEQKGLLDKGMNPSDDHLANLIFVPGFSTADKVTQVSGRGVGMDVVQSELKQVGGSVSLTTEKNVGTRFSIRLPLSMTVAQAMIIASGGERYAVPLMAILSINMVHRSRIITDSSGENSVAIGDKTYPYISLAERLGLLAQLEDETKTPALMMNSATGPIVVGVDELIHATEVVVKSVGVQVASLDGIEGATVLGDGNVALIIDLVDLWNTRHAERAEIDQASLVAKMEEDVSPATVMVVDDSLTVRRVTERNLTKYGITTLLATDGVDALEKLSNDVPDVMLVDIEMPRMDGFELTERVRDDPVYKNIPIIIITSRSGPKHRDRAMQLGATLYLTKPYQELELMNAINSVLPLESSRKISAMMEA